MNYAERNHKAGGHCLAGLQVRNVHTHRLDRYSFGSALIVNVNIGVARGRAHPGFAKSKSMNSTVVFRIH